ncbi:glycoside hydrolase family 19 protein [Acinetobacter gerneri]
MKEFPVKSRPLGKSNSNDKYTNNDGVVEILSSPNRDIEILVLNTKDQFVLKASVNSKNGSHSPQIIKLDEAYESFSSITIIKVLDRKAEHYVVADTNVEMIFDGNKRMILPVKEGKFRLKSWIGQQIKLTIYKPDGKPLDTVTYIARRVQTQYVDLQLDVDVTNGKTNTNNPKILKRIEDRDKGKCLCNRDMTLDELNKMILEMRKSEGLKTTKIFNHKNCTLEDKSVEALLSELNRTFKKYNINTCLRKINFMGQIYWEAARFITTTEFASGNYLNPHVHKNAIKNGNIVAGDGPRYKGRGFMQLTWRNNYKKYFNYILNNKNDYNTILNGLNINDMMDRSKKYPELVASKNLLAMDSAGWFWIFGTDLNLNEQSDKNAVLTISRKVNGGGNGKKERLEYNKRLLVIMNYSQCVNKI